MIALLTTLLIAPAQAYDLEGGNALEGHRIVQATHGSGIGVYNRFVVGPDGGTTAIGLAARYGTDQYSFSIGVPVTAHQTPLGRAVDMGNLDLSGFYHVGEVGPMFMSIGADLHFNVGDAAYTWTNHPEEFWPGYGGNVVWQARIDGEPMTYLFRGTIGVHGARSFVPFPELFMRVSGAAALDYAITNWAGLVGEMSVSYWDTSPWELSALARFDAVEGARIRAGIVLPIGVWAGLDPARRNLGGGVRETTLMLDASLAF